MMPGASVVNFEHILHCAVIIAELKQMNASWARETVVSHNKFVFSNYGQIYCPMG